MVTQIWTQNCL